MDIPPAEIVNFVSSRLVGVSAVPLITSGGDFWLNRSRFLRMVPGGGSRTPKGRSPADFESNPFVFQTIHFLYLTKSCAQLCVATWEERFGLVRGQWSEFGQRKCYVNNGGCSPVVRGIYETIFGTGLINSFNTNHLESSYFSSFNKCENLGEFADLMLGYYGSMIGEKNLEVLKLTEAHAKKPPIAVCPADLSAWQALRVRC